MEMTAGRMPGRDVLFEPILHTWATAAAGESTNQVNVDDWPNASQRMIESAACCCGGRLLLLGGLRDLIASLGAN